MKVIKFCNSLLMHSFIKREEKLTFQTCVQPLFQTNEKFYFSLTVTFKKKKNCLLVLKEFWREFFLVLCPYLSHESPLSLPPENWFRRVSWRWPWTGRGRWSGPSKPSNRLDQVSCRELCNLKNTKKLSMGYSDTNMMASATDIMATSASANVAADDFFSWWTMAANWLNEKHCCQFTKLGKSLIGKTWQNLTTAWSENAGPNNSASKFEQPTDFEIQLSQAYKKPKWSPTLFYCFLNVLLWKNSIWNR